MTLLYDLGVILLGEIRCLSLLGVKGLSICNSPTVIQNLSYCTSSFDDLNNQQNPAKNHKNWCISSICRYASPSVWQLKFWKKGVAFTLVFTVICKSFWLLYSTMISLVMVSNSVSFPSFSLTQSYLLQLNYLYLLSFQHKFLILLHVFIHGLFHSSSKNRTHCV